MSLNLDGRWGRLEPVSLGGRVLHPDAEDLALILCLHGSRHLWQRLNWICDVAQLVRLHPGMDWSRVMERATTPVSQRMLLLGLFLAKDLLGAPLPEQVWRKVQHDPATASLAKQVRGLLLRWPPGPLEYFERIRFHLKMRDRLQDRIGYCARHFWMLVMTPQPSDWKSVPLPEALFHLYYVLRPMRFAVSAAKYALRRMNHIYSQYKGG